MRIVFALISALLAQKKLNFCFAIRKFASALIQFFSLSFLDNSDAKWSSNQSANKIKKV